MRIAIHTVAYDGRKKDFFADGEHALSVIADSNLYQKVFFSYSSSMVVEVVKKDLGSKHFVGARIHIDGKPFFDATFQSKHVLDQVDQICKSLIDGFPFYAAAIGWKGKNDLSFKRRLDAKLAYENLEEIDMSSINAEKPKAKKAKKEQARTEKEKQEAASHEEVKVMPIVKPENAGNEEVKEEKASQENAKTEKAKKAKAKKDPFDWTIGETWYWQEKPKRKTRNAA